MCSNPCEWGWPWGSCPCHTTGRGVPAPLPQGRHRGLAVLQAVGPQWAWWALLHQPQHVQNHQVKGCTTKICLHHLKSCCCNRSVCVRFLDISTGLYVRCSWTVSSPWLQCESGDKMFMSSHYCWLLNVWLGAFWRAILDIALGFQICDHW